MGLSLSTGRSGPPSPWSDLPPELGGLILCRLVSHADRLNFRAVCRQWRLAAQQERSVPPALPWIRLNYRTIQSLLPGGSGGGDRRRPKLTAIGLGLSHTSTAATPSDGWLKYKFHNHIDNIDSYYLFNPFPGATIDLPPVPEPEGDGQIRKMIVCSPDLVAAMTLGTGAVGLYRPIGGAPSWSVSPSPHRSNNTYTDIAFHRGKLYALTSMEELWSHELVDDDSIRVVVPPKATRHVVEHVIKEHIFEETPICYQRYLVASCDDDKLLLVRWFGADLWLFDLDQPTIHEKCDALKLDVFEADLETGRWVKVRDVDGLKGQTLFVSGNCSKAVRLLGTNNNNDHSFRGDHVYFLGDELGAIHPDFRTYLYGSYDLRKDRIGELVLKRKRNTKDDDVRSPPEWFFPCIYD